MYVSMEQMKFWIKFQKCYVYDTSISILTGKCFPSEWLRNSNRKVQHFPMILTPLHSSYSCIPKSRHTTLHKTADYGFFLLDIESLLDENKHKQGYRIKGQGDSKKGKIRKTRESGNGSLVTSVATITFLFFSCITSFFPYGSFFKVAA